MAAYKAFWYTDDGNLRRLGRHHLRALLAAYAGELAAAGLAVEEPERDEEYYRRLAAVFMRPEGIPAALHEALYHIKGLDSDTGLNRIAWAAGEGLLRLDMGENSSTADKVLQAWLQDRELVRRLHVEVGLDASKSFVHFRPVRQPAPPMRALDAAVKAAFGKEQGEVFLAHGRGRFCEIERHFRNGEHVFVVRHGNPYRRDTEYRDDAAEPLYYWPVVQDLVVYTPATQTLRMNVQPPWHKRSYARNVGRHLFGDPDLFAERNVFTLQPLRDRGREVLDGTLYGIGEIALVELQSAVDEDLNDVRIRRSRDVFESYEREGGLPEEEELTQAGFRVRFAGAKSHRTVTVSGSRARYTQDRNGRHVTAWLQGNGFVIGGKIEAWDVEDGGDGGDGVE